MIVRDPVPDLRQPFHQIAERGSAKRSFRGEPTCRERLKILRSVPVQDASPERRQLTEGMRIREQGADFRGARATLAANLLCDSEDELVPTTKRPSEGVGDRFIEIKAGWQPQPGPLEQGDQRKPS